ncbi:hypothetical protein COOONC_08721 [Cooperia oncophora]
MFLQDGHYENLTPLNKLARLPPPPKDDAESRQYENVATNVDLVKVLQEMASESRSKEELSMESKSGERKTKQKKEKAARKGTSTEQKSKEGKLAKGSKEEGVGSKEALGLWHPLYYFNLLGGILKQ